MGPQRTEVHTATLRRTVKVKGSLENLETQEDTYRIWFGQPKWTLVNRWLNVEG